MPRSILSLSFFACFVITGCAIAVFSHAQVPQPVTVRPLVADAEVGDRVWTTARQGEIDQLEKMLDQTEDSTRFKPLQDAWHAYTAQDKQRTEARRQAHQERFDAIATSLQADEFDEALNAAIEARDLADDPKEYLNRPAIKSLVDEARARAKKAEKTNDWIEAMSLYRRLDLLFDETYGISDDLMRVGTHLRLLRMYAPSVLRQLQEDRAKKFGEEPPVRWDDGEETWERELRDIQPSMLNQALIRAESLHVEKTDYNKLMIGAIDSLRLLLANEGLEETFPGMKNAQAIKAFDDYLSRRRESLLRPGNNTTSYHAALAMVNDIFEKNKETVAFPEAVMVYEMSNGITGTLDDFTGMIWPSDKERFARTTEGNFSGVGIQITLEDGRLIVVSPLEGTPAHLAGIRPGDEIAQIEGRSTEGIRLDQAVDAITGEAGTTVTLGVRPAGEQEIRMVKIVRAKIKIASVKGWERGEGGWDYYVDPELKIGYIRLTNFGPETADDLDRAIKTMVDAGGVNGLVLDMRFNPGGLLSAAIDISNRFVKEGIIVSQAGRTSEKPIISRAELAGTYPEFPVVVLVNNSSASASEIVAGCLQENHRAIVVGERTYGKGSVQQIYPLSLGRAYLKLTTQYYMLPSGRVIHRRPQAEKWGVDPDINIPMTGREMARLLDARSALDVLRDPEAKELVEKPLKPENAEAAEADAELPMPKTVKEFLDQGVDPQLQFAVMLLKAKVLAHIPSEELPVSFKAKAAAK